MAGVEGCIGTVSFLDRLPNALFASDDGDAPCLTCIDAGACKEWVKAMASDAEVDVEWLAEMVTDGKVDHQWGIDDVQRLSAEQSVKS